MRPILGARLQEERRKPTARVELATYGLQNRCSAIELHRRNWLQPPVSSGFTTSRLKVGDSHSTGKSTGPVENRSISAQKFTKMELTGPTQAPRSDAQRLLASVNPWHLRLRSSEKLFPCSPEPLEIDRSKYLRQMTQRRGYNVKITKIKDGQFGNSSAVSGSNLHRDERFAKIQATALMNEWKRLRLCSSRQDEGADLSGGEVRGGEAVVEGEAYEGKLLLSEDHTDQIERQEPLSWGRTKAVKCKESACVYHRLQSSMVAFQTQAQAMRRRNIGSLVINGSLSKRHLQ